MPKTNVLDNLGHDDLEPANNNFLVSDVGRESNIISLSQYRDRIKKIPTDRNPLPPCAQAIAA
jgi:hypothetical protein